MMSAEDIRDLIHDRMVSRGQSLKHAAADFRSKFPPEVVDAAVEIIRREIGEVEDLRDPATVSRRRFVPWYGGPSQGDRFWPKYEQYLTDVKQWDSETVRVIDKASTRIVSRLPCPSDDTYSGRGLVLGYVQSGKTANFTAVAAKAADQGYRLIVVLSGLTNVLRQQTQERLENDLVGQESTDWMTWTKRDGDIGDIPIRAGALLSQPSIRHLAVVKKNSARLRRLRDMLRAAGDHVLSNCPVLIIDDECDQASVNSARLEQERTAINRLLIEILDLPPKVAYVGYTATPFANVLVDPQHPQDLYPRDFVINLPRPDQYFGAERLFGRSQLESDATDEGLDDGLDMIRTIGIDEESELRPANRSEKDTWRLPITTSVASAIRYFLMASAAKEIRKGKPSATSMLIHTTFYAQSMLNSEPVIQRYLDELQDRIRSSDETLISELGAQWESEVDAVPPDLFGNDPISTAEVFGKLSSILERTRVFVENGQSEQRIEEYDGPFIVIGGNILARGLTLEGLICSLFVRTTSMYDSLMQMGRWFGYRTGYEEMPRVWMPDLMASYYRDLATVEHEIRQDIARYSDDGETSPRDLGVRIRLHPRLEVTSKLKQRSGRIVGQSSYAGEVLQTIRFATHDAAWLRENLLAGQTLLERCRDRLGSGPEQVGNMGRLFREVDWSIVSPFFDEYQIHQTHADFSIEGVRRYVEHQQRYGTLMSWNIGIAYSNATAASKHAEFGPLRDVPMFNRSARHDLPDGGKNIGVLLAKQHATIDFPSRFDGPRETWADIKRARSTTPGRRPVPATSNPILLFYLVDQNSVYKGSSTASSSGQQRHALEAVDDVLGIGLVFPQTDNPDPVEYIVADLGETEVEDVDIDDFTIEETLDG